MLWTIAIIFVLMWLLGLATSFTLGGYVHVLLGVAIALMIVRYIQGRSHKNAGHSHG